MSKVQRVMEHIRDNYQDWTIDSYLIWRLMAECDCCQSTVRKAIRALRTMRTIEDNKYVGCYYVSPHALVDAMKPLAIHSMFTWKTEHYDLFGKRFFTHSSNAIWQAIDQAIMWGLIQPAASGHVYGWMLRIMERAS